MTTNLAGRIDLGVRVSLLLLAVAAVLAVVLVVGKTRPEPLPLAASALRSAAINLPPMDGVPGGALVENPLFWASRRPYNAPVAEAEEEVRPSGPTAIDDMQLVGIIAAGIDGSAVIVTIRGQRQRIPFGGGVGDWELTSMTPTTATFTGADRNGEMMEHTFNLEDSREQFPVMRRGAVNANPSDRDPGTESQDGI